MTKATNKCYFSFLVPATPIITGTANIRETKDAYAAMLSMARVC